MILDIYTQDHGLMSFIVGGVRKTNSRQANIFHPVNIIDLVAYRSDSRLSRIKEAQLAVRYENIQQDIPRSTVAMFIIDLARSSIREKESNSELYGFLRQALLSLDQSSENLSLAPHLFALELSRFLGFAPFPNHSDAYGYFDMLEGEFTDNDVRHKHILSLELSSRLNDLMQERLEFKASKTTRAELLDKLMEYYKLHIEGFREMKSLEILRAVLS